MIYSGTNVPVMNRAKLFRRLVLTFSVLLNLHLLSKNPEKPYYDEYPDTVPDVTTGSRQRRNHENIIEVQDPGLSFENVEKTFSLSILHIFEPFGNEELGRNVRQGHRQNYRDLAIRYPHIELNVIFVGAQDDRDIGHEDVYKHDFWAYPWPEALVVKLAKFPRTLVLTKNTEIVRHLDGIEKIDLEENQADIQFINPIFYLCEKKCDMNSSVLNDGIVIGGKDALDPSKRHCMVGSPSNRFILSRALLELIAHKKRQSQYALTGIRPSCFLQG